MVPAGDTVSFSFNTFIDLDDLGLSMEDIDHYEMYAYKEQYQ